jgi:hypothetical protein
MPHSPSGNFLKTRDRFGCGFFHARVSEVFASSRIRGIFADTIETFAIVVASLLAA